MITSQRIPTEAEVGPNSVSLAPGETPVTAIVSHPPPPIEPLPAELEEQLGSPVHAAGRTWSGEPYGAVIGFELAEDWAAAQLVAGIDGWPASDEGGQGDGE